ncbi:MAG: hypothetical protein Q8930_20245 [Bacillota bacterium]|nr:hypothetical protein [Bacillota bacterium]
MNKKLPVLSIVLYVIAGILVLYTIWGVIHTAQYLNGLFAQGQLTVAGHIYDIVNFYMSSCAQYLIFAVILFTLGVILKKTEIDRSAAFETGDTIVPRVEGLNNREDGENLEVPLQNNEK